MCVTCSPYEASISGADTICTGQPAILIFNFAGGTPSYNVTYLGGGGGTINDIVDGWQEQVFPGSTTTYTLKSAFDANACPATTLTGSAKITVIPTPATPGLITGNATVCQGASAIYSVAPVTGATTYNWTVPVGAFIQSGQNSNSVTVNWGTASTGNICVTAANACGTSTASCKTVTVNAKPNVNLGPDRTFCGASSLTLDAGSGSGYSYSWSTGASTQTINVSSANTYMVNVTNTNNGCLTSDTVIISTGSAIQISNISSSNLNGSFTLTGGLPQTNGSNYSSVTMTLQGNPGVTATLTGAPWTHGETVGFTAPQGGTYQVAVVDGGGCTGTVAVAINNCPGSFATAWPDTVICAGQPVTLYASGGIIYQWSNGGPADSVWTVTPTQSDTFVVSVTDAMGCTDTARVFISVASPMFANGYETNCGKAFVLPNTSGTCSNLFTWARPNHLYDHVEDCLSFIVTEQISNPTVQAILNLTNPFNYNATQSFQIFPTAQFPVGITTVTYTATEANGNSATCAFTVEIQDTQTPVLTCPPNQTLPTTCPTAKIPDYTGLVIVTDNCPANVTVTQSIPPSTTLATIFSPNPPAAGNQFTLTMTGKDTYQNTANCTFTVTLEEGEAPIPNLAILSDLIDSCGSLIVLAPSATNPCVPGAPVIYGTPSTPVGIFLNTNPPSYQFNPGNYAITWVYNDGNGNISTQPQNITVLNDVFPPVAICVPNLTLTLDPVTGQVAINASELNNGSFDPNDCGQLTFSVSPVMLTCANAGPSPTAGTLTARDFKGNPATCTTWIIVRDVTKPTAICSNNIDISLDSSGIALLQSEDIDLGSTDNCGIDTAFLNKSIFTCADIGINIITLTLADKSGNTNFCTVNVDVLPGNSFILTITNTPETILGANDGTASVLVTMGSGNYSYTWSNLDTSSTIIHLPPGVYYVTVTDLVSGCMKADSTVISPGANEIRIEGQVKTWSGGGVPVPDVKIALSGDIADSTVTGVPGVYSFFVPPGTNTTSTPSKTDTSNFNADINIADLFSIQNHAAGIYTLTNSYQYVAGDVSNNGKIDLPDFLLVQQVILGATQHYSNGAPDWKFIPASYIFPAPNPLATLYPQSISHTPANIDYLSDDFTAVRIGDVIAANPSGTFSGILRVDSVELPSVYQDTFLVPLRLYNFSNIAGVQFSLSWDTLDLQYVHVSKLDPNLLGAGFDTISFLNQGKLTFSWVGLGGLSVPDTTILFSVAFTRKNGCSSLIEIIGNPTPVMAIDPLGSISNIATSPGLVYTLDSTPAFIICPDNVQSAATSPTQIFDIAPVSVLDDCAISSVGWSVSGATTGNYPNAPDASGSTFNLGQSSVTYLATDLGGNTTSCSFLVNLNSAPGDSLTLIASNNAASCGETVVIHVTALNFDSLGAIQFSLGWGPAILQFDSVFNLNPAMQLAPSSFDINQTGNGFLGFAWTTSDPFSGTTLNNGETLFSISFTATGSVNNNSSIAFGDFVTQGLAFTVNPPIEIDLLTIDGSVTITDTVPPELMCPSNVLTSAPSGNISVTVNGLEPAALADNCGSVTLSYQQNGSTAGQGQGLANGVYNAGTTTVIYTAADPSGNSAICIFTIEVVPGNPITLKILPDTSYAQVVDKIIVDLAVEEFINIAGLRFDLNWDKDILRFDSVSGAYNGLNLTTNMFFGFSSTVNGILEFFGGNGTGWPHIPDNNAFFKIHFTAIKPGYSNLEFGGIIEASNTSFNYVPVQTINGVAFVTCYPVNTSINIITPACSDSVEINASGDFVQWQWSTGKNGMFSSISVSTPGTYTVTVTDANGCTGTDSHSINGNVPAPSPVIDGPNALCSGAATLSVTGAYSDWKWSNNQTGTNAITVNTQETFTVTVTDANGCTGTDSHTLNGNVPAPSPSIAGPSALCSGAATLTVTGTYSDWKWSNNQTGTNAITVNTQETFTVTVTDAYGCTGTDSHSLNGNVPAPSPVIDGPSALCSGAATLSVSDTYSDWKWSTNQTGTNAITVNTQETFTVTVTDANGCTGTDSHTLNGNVPSPSPSFDGPSALCSGIATLSVSDTYTDWKWSNNQTGTNAITVNTQETFTVTVTDANGCTGTDSHTLNGNVPAPSPSIDGPSALCSGAATLTVTGIYSDWKWSNNQTGTNVITVITLETFTVTVTDANGCTGTDSHSLNGNVPAPSPVIDGPTALCSGAATLTVTGTYSDWKWSNNQTGTNAITVNDPGIYTVTVTDLYGCTGTDSTTINASNDPLPLAAQHQPVSQPGASDGIGVIHLQGVASPYSLNWSGPVSGSLAGQTADSVFIGNLAAGDYSVTVTDANGCTGTAFFSIVLDNCAAAPAAQIQSDSLPCTGNDLQLSETGGQAVAWAWAGPNNFSATAQNPVVPALTSLASGDYRVTVTDANGCTAIAVKTITVLPVPVAQIFANPGQLCEGEDIQLGDNGSGGAAWQWQGPNGFVSTQQSPLIQNAGNANSGVYNLLVRHANGCTDTASVEVNVFEHYFREISASVCAGESYEFCDKVYTKPGTYTCDYTTVNDCDSVVTLNLTVLPLPQISTLEDTITLPAGASELVILAAQNDVVPPNNLWDFDIIAKPAAGSVEISDTVLVYRLNQQSFSGLDSFRYWICSRVCANICDSAWVRLFIPGNQDDSLKRFLTNVLTPGLEDGINDLFDPVEAFIKNNYPVSKATLSIYNRTGMLIYREESERPTWNGQLISGALAPQAPYFYAIEAEVGTDSPRIVWGIITVLR